MAVGWRGQYYKYREFSLNLLALYKQRSDVQAFLEIVLSLTTLIVFMVFAIKPTALTMISLNKEIKAKEETLNGLNQKITNLQAANEVFAQNANLIPNIEEAIFNSPKPSLLSGQILGAANKNAVTVVGISIGQTTILGKVTMKSEKDPKNEVKPLPNNANSIPVSISVKGDYKSLISFLRDLENLRIPIRIDSTTISSSQITSNNLTEMINGRVPFIGE